MSIFLFGTNNSIVLATSTSSSNDSPDEHNLFIADFTNNGWGDKRKMQTINDPVMGGRSYSSITQEKDFLKWSGEVKIVPFLQKPGFCVLQTAGFDQSFPKNLGDYTGISFIVNVKYGDELPLSAEIFNDYITPNGVPVKYHAKLKNITLPDLDGKVELYAPWEEFTGMMFGREIPEAPKLDRAGLSKVDQIGLSTFWSHKKGQFEVDLYQIFATAHPNSPSETKGGLRAKIQITS